MHNNNNNNNNNTRDFITRDNISLYNAFSNLWTSYNLIKQKM